MDPSLALPMGWPDQLTYANRIEMYHVVLSNLRSCWKTLTWTDLLFKAIAFVAFAPLVGLLFRIFVWASGRTVVADTDIAMFLLNPIGLMGALVVGTGLLALYAIEIASLMLVCLAAKQGGVPRPRCVFRFVATNVRPILKLAARVVVGALLIAVPFLAVGGAIFWWMLTDHDINYYLTEKPPAAIAAVIVIALILLALAGCLIRYFVELVYSTPIVMLESYGARDAIVESRSRSLGNRRQIAWTIVCWAVFNLIVGILITSTTIWLAQRLVPQVSGIGMLVVAIGILVLGLSLGNLLGNVLGNITLASCLSMLYAQERDQSMPALPDFSMRPVDAFGVRMTTGRTVAATIVAILVAALIGSSLIHSLDLTDRVVITAHRGGAYHAPENTLAAVERGLQDGADWIEIDVQESSDGVVMVIHDSDLMKVAKNPVKIWNATAEELRAIDIGSFFSPEFSDQRMPTLDEVLKLCRGRAGVNIELKYYGHQQDLERRVVEIVEANQMQDQIVIMSLDGGGIQRMQALRPDWTYGRLTAVAAGDLTRLDVDFLAVKDSLATQTFVSSAHRSGKTVAAWTLNDEYTISRMISRGVDNLITDRPALVHEVLRTRAALDPMQRLSLELAVLLNVEPQVD